MRVKVNLKNADEKLNAIEEAERHLKKAKELILWSLSGELEIELTELQEQVKERNGK